jgi:hypothetical protein
MSETVWWSGTNPHTDNVADDGRSSIDAVHRSCSNSFLFTSIAQGAGRAARRLRQIQRGIEWRHQYCQRWHDCSSVGQARIPSTGRIMGKSIQRTTNTVGCGAPSCTFKVGPGDDLGRFVLVTISQDSENLKMFARVK